VLTKCGRLIQPLSGLKPFFSTAPQGRTVTPLPRDGPALGWIMQSLQDWRRVRTELTVCASHNRARDLRLGGERRQRFQDGQAGAGGVAGEFAEEC
jgi:hypothetical protein